MGLGTGLTVATLVALAAGARDAATRLGARLSTRRAAMLRQAIEALAAVAVLLLGLSLLEGNWRPCAEAGGNGTNFARPGAGFN